MDALSLLAEAHAAGLTIQVVGDKLVVHGPRTAAPLVERLREHKLAIMAVLVTAPVGDPGFCYAGDSMAFGDICEGWGAAPWAERLRQMAARCDQYRPDIAAHYRLWAADIEARLRAAGFKFQESH
jgi:hypothetical protein